jgi:hypothetical protein
VSDAEDPKPKMSKAKLAEMTRKHDWKKVMGMPEGRRLMWSTLDLLGVYSDTGHTDPIQVGRFLGARSKGLQLLAEIIEVCPDEYLQMQVEAMRKDKEEMTHE